MIEYKKMSLFDAPNGSLIVHACNAKGVWGSGIAKEFKERYSKEHNVYNYDCTYINMIGRFGCCMSKRNDKRHIVGWLVTSVGYADTKSSVNDILIYTASSIGHLISKNITKTIYSNKFNSGLFQVPWEKTENIIETFLKQHPEIKWIVCDPDLKEQYG